MFFDTVVNQSNAQNANLSNNFSNNVSSGTNNSTSNVTNNSITFGGNGGISGADTFGLGQAISGSGSNSFTMPSYGAIDFGTYAPVNDTKPTMKTTNDMTASVGVGVGGGSGSGGAIAQSKTTNDNVPAAATNPALQYANQQSSGFDGFNFSTSNIDLNNIITLIVIIGAAIFGFKYLKKAK